MAYTDFNRAGRQIAGSIKVTDSQNAAHIFSSSNYLVSFDVSRTAPNNKVFGFILSETINFKLINSNYIPQIGDAIEYGFQEANESEITYCGGYVITEVSIDDTKNEVSVKGSDAATAYLKSNTFSSLELEYPATLQDIIDEITNVVYSIDSTLDIECTDENINIKGEDTLYDVLVWILELTGGIGYVNNSTVECYSANNNLWKGTYLARYIGGENGWTWIYGTVDKNLTAAIPCKPNTVYTIVKRVNSGIGSRFVIADYPTYNPANNTDMTNYQLFRDTDAIATVATVKTHSDANYLYIYVSHEVGNAPDLLVFEAGTAATKNLLDIANYLNTTKTSNAITTKRLVNNKLTCRGTATSTWADITTHTSALTLKPGTYTFSVKNNMSGASLNLKCKRASASATFDWTINKNTKSSTRIITEDTDVQYLFIGGMTVGQVLDISIENIQIEEGNTATQYISAFETISIDKNNYFNLSYADDVKLKGINLATQLGDNVVGGTNDDYCQVIWDNPIVALREDRQAIATNLYNALSGSSFIPYNIEYRGNPYIKPWHNTTIFTIDDTPLYGIKLLSNKIEYTGGMKASSEYTKPEQQESTSSGPASVGDMVKNTYAQVDRINNKIEIQTQQISGNTNSISSINLTIDGISSNVSRAEQKADEATTTANNTASQFETYKTSIEQSTRSIVATAIAEIADEDGNVKSVKTTNATLDNNGLTVQQSGYQTETAIDAEGLTVQKSNQGEKLLEAVVEGGVGIVRTANLESNTYIKIGTRSRIEDYVDDTDDATGIFWIGL